MCSAASVLCCVCRQLLLLLRPLNSTHSLTRHILVSTDRHCLQAASPAVIFQGVLRGLLESYAPCAYSSLEAHSNPLCLPLPLTVPQQMNNDVAADTVAASSLPSPSCHAITNGTLISPSNSSSSSFTPFDSSPAAPPPPTTRLPSTPIDRPAHSFVSYHNQLTSTLGCPHYSRKCQVRAPCCSPDTFYPCRFCHDEQCDHSIDRHAISHMVCLLCCQRVAKSEPARSQPVASTCVDCSQHMAAYWCDVCNFFDDEPGREIFHCGACGICRRGKASEFFHCQRCNCCYSSSLRANHKCIENVLSSVW